NPNWYNSLMLPITDNEITQTIASLPNGKACGPTGISYEMIKHISSSCITKKNAFDGNLNLTRPISLIEHFRKLYTKILTNRLNHIFSQYPILSLFNYVALPGNSTSNP